MTYASRLILTSLAAALTFGIAGACYDLTPIPTTPSDAGAPCTPDPSLPDACAAEPGDGGDIEADIEADIDGDFDASVDAEPVPDADLDGGSGEEPNP